MSGLISRLWPSLVGLSLGRLMSPSAMEALAEGPKRGDLRSAERVSAMNHPAAVIRGIATICPVKSPPEPSSRSFLPAHSMICAVVASPFAHRHRLTLR
jgi:hypothetical protein